MLRRTLGILCLLCSAAWATAAPINVPTGWTRTAAITINGQTYGGSVGSTGYPCMVTLPTECITNGGAYACQSNGGDLRFTSDAAGTSGLNCEVVSTFNYTNPQVWVKIPFLSVATATTIYVWYHYPSATIAQPSATDNTWGSNKVWDTSFVGVWHMETTNPADSTGNGNGGTGDTGVSATTGQIGTSLVYNGTSHAEVSVGTGLNSVKIPMTVSCWVNDSTNNTNVYIQAYQQGGSYPGWGFGLGVATIGYPCFYNGAAWNYANATVANSQWHYLALVISSTSTNGAQFYIDNAAKGTATIAAPTAFSGTDYLGTLNSGQYPNYTFDEVRVSSTNRSASWILAEYNNTYSPSTFSTAPATGNPTAWVQSLGLFAMMYR